MLYRKVHWILFLTHCWFHDVDERSDTTVDVLNDVCQGFKLSTSLNLTVRSTQAMTGGLIDKSVDLRVEQIQFLGEISDRDGPSTSFTDIDNTRASTLVLICRFLTIFAHRSHC